MKHFTPTYSKNFPEKNNLITTLSPKQISLMSIQKIDKKKSRTDRYKIKILVCGCTPLHFTNDTLLAGLFLAELNLLLVRKRKDHRQRCKYISKTLGWKKLLRLTAVS